MVIVAMVGGIGRGGGGGGDEFAFNTTNVYQCLSVSLLQKCTWRQNEIQLHSTWSCVSGQTCHSRTE